MDWKISDDRPIWLQLSEQMARRIVTGVYAPGSKLPTVRELAAEAGVNPNTMQRALAQLDQDGLTRADRTAGRTVTGDTGVIEEARRAYAKVNIDLFLEGMAELGYDREAAISLLEDGVL